VPGTDLVDRLAEHQTLGGAPREERAWLAAHGVLRHLDDGEALVAAGATVDGLWILLTRWVAIFVDRGAGRHKVMDWRAGDVSGVLPYSRLVNAPGDSVAQEPTDILVVERGHLPSLIRECHQVTTILVQRGSRTWTRLRWPSPSIWRRVWATP
jgi:CRP-like cAMP-binding protein